MPQNYDFTIEYVALQALVLNHLKQLSTHSLTLAREVPKSLI